MSGDIRANSSGGREANILFALAQCSIQRDVENSIVQQSLIMAASHFAWKARAVGNNCGSEAFSREKAEQIAYLPS
jgi:hypothetical protein